MVIPICPIPDVRDGVGFVIEETLEINVTFLLKHFKLNLVCRSVCMNIIILKSIPTYIKYFQHVISIVFIRTENVDLTFFSIDIIIHS